MPFGLSAKLCFACRQPELRSGERQAQDEGAWQDWGQSEGGGKAGGPAGKLGMSGVRHEQSLVLRRRHTQA